VDSREGGSLVRDLSLHRHDYGEGEVSDSVSSGR